MSAHETQVQSRLQPQGVARHTALRMARTIRLSRRIAEACAEHAADDIDSPLFGADSIAAFVAKAQGPAVDAVTMAAIKTAYAEEFSRRSSLAHRQSCRDARDDEDALLAELSPMSTTLRAHGDTPSWARPATRYESSNPTSASAESVSPLPGSSSVAGVIATAREDKQ